MNYKIIKKTLSIIILLIFTCSNVLYAQTLRVLEAFNPDSVIDEWNEDKVSEIAEIIYGNNDIPEHLIDALKMDKGRRKFWKALLTAFFVEKLESNQIKNIANILLGWGTLQRCAEELELSVKINQRDGAFILRYGDPSIGNAEYHRIYIDERGRPIYEANVSASYFTGRMLSITKNDPKGKWQLPIDYLKGKVIAIQGIGGTGGQLLQPLLEAGAIVIASDVDLPTIESVNTEYTSDINSNKLFIFQEEKLPGGGYTNKIMNPLEAFPEKLKGMGVTNIDVFSPCAIGPVVNPETVKKLKAAGVKIICGACNNVTEDKKRDPELLKQAGIAYIPDYIANAGGVTGVDGHLGHNVTDMGISKRIFNRVEDILLTSSIRNKPPQVVADETSRKFFEALKQVRLSGYQLTFGEKFSNRMYPKEGLNDLTFDDGSKVRVLTAKEDYPEEVLEHWDKHYAVFEITNEELGYTAYMAIHRLTKIESESRRVNGQYRATGGTRILKYKSNNAALADALELSQEMSFKNAGAGLAIGGSKCTINVKIDPRSNGKDAMARRQVLISYAKAIEKIGNLIGGGVLTGQDVNISVTDAKLFFEHAPTSIVPYIAPHLCIAPTRPTGIGVFAAMVAALKNTSEPLSYAVKLRDMFDVRFVNTTSL